MSLRLFFLAFILAAGISLINLVANRTAVERTRQEHCEALWDRISHPAMDPDGTPAEETADDFADRQDFLRHCAP